MTLSNFTRIFGFMSSSRFKEIINVVSLLLNSVKTFLQRTISVISREKMSNTRFKTFPLKPLSDQ